MNRPSIVALAGAASGIALALSACGGGPSSSSPPAAAPPTSSPVPTTSATTPSASASAPTSSAPAPSMSTSSAAAAQVITIKSFMYAVPPTVAPGSTLTLRNEDSATHTVTSVRGGFDVRVPGGGGTATLTAPTAPGSYELVCDFHANMKAVLVVR